MEGIYYGPINIWYCRSRSRTPVAEKGVINVHLGQFILRMLYVILDYLLLPFRIDCSEVITKVTQMYLQTEQLLAE